MKRRDFTKSSLVLGMGLVAGPVSGRPSGSHYQSEDYYEEPGKKLPARKFDVVVAGGGTAGVVAAIAAARQGAKTVLIEMKGYPGGTVTEGGTTIHSFFNTWKPFPGVRKRQVIKGIPDEIVRRLDKIGGWCGFGDMLVGHRDSTNTVIDTELYKLVTFEILVEAGVYVCVNTLLAGAIMRAGRAARSFMRIPLWTVPPTVIFLHLPERTTANRTITQWPMLLAWVMWILTRSINIWPTVTASGNTLWVSAVA